jgi:hypothetical protein
MAIIATRLCVGVLDESTEFGRVEVADHAVCVVQCGRFQGEAGHCPSCQLAIK